MGFGDVAMVGGRAVRIDVADALRRQPGVLQRLPHGHGHGCGLRLGHVGAVAVGAVADDLGQHARATCLGVLQFLEHQRAGALTQHQAVAVRVERTRRGLGGVVARAGGEQRVENGRLGRIQLLAAAGQHRHLAARADRLVGVADALAAGRARAGGGQNAPRDAKEHPDIDRRGVRHHADVGGGADVLGGALGHHPAEVLDRGWRARGRAVGDAHLPARDDRMAGQAGIRQRGLAGQHRHQRDAAHGPRGLARVVSRQREWRHRRPELRVQALDVGPLRHPHHGIAAAGQALAHRGPVVAQCADRARAGYDNPLHPNIPPFTEITCRVM
ncbi:hypothetical protein D3C81_922140 [compost metagenome]